MLIGARFAYVSSWNECVRIVSVYIVLEIKKNDRLAANLCLGLGVGWSKVGNTAEESLKPVIHGRASAKRNTKLHP